MDGPIWKDREWLGFAVRAPSKGAWTQADSNFERRMRMNSLFAACWFVATILLVRFLRPSDGCNERAIVSFPGAWIIVGLLLTLSFGASGILLVRNLFFA